jgi:predicted N-acyltransferase
MDELGMASAEYRIELVSDPSGVDAAKWDALLAIQPHPTPFMSHAYLKALVDSGSACADTGWAPLWLALRQGERLAGATVVWVKSHSYGEYVFDWAWADAYARHGLDYYPKLLLAVPFTPVPGSRLLGEDAHARQLLLQGMRALARQQAFSSVHLLFSDAAEQALAQSEGWLMRTGVQFHWQNRKPDRYADFSDFLASLQREKRKKIQQERRKVAEQGISFRTLEGPEILQADWDFFYRCYTLTYRAHHSTPYLTRDFFSRMATEMASNWLMFVAEREGRPIAASLVAIERRSGTAWGRYWGCTEQAPCLHFEACYYKPLDWCISQGFLSFEGGAQGEHKMARGLLPVATASAHWLAHPQFSQAVEDFLSREGKGMEHYLDELRERNPFKPTVDADIPVG